jgi:hypothetical protein
MREGAHLERLHETRDLQNLVANGAIAGAGFEPATSGL